MTKAEWEAAEQKLMSPWGVVRLICDGFKLSLHTQRDKMRLVIMPYIDDEFKGVWIGTDCEERRRFMRIVKHKRWKKTMWKGFTKKDLKQLDIDPDETFDSYTPWWTSFKTLKAHLIKNNTSIELAPEV